MAESANSMRLPRRKLLKSLAAVPLAASCAPAIATASEIESDFTAIPTEVFDAIKAWQEAHRASKRAAEVYAASLGAQPIDKAACDRCYRALAEANLQRGPTREAMIAALWKV